MPIFEYKAFTPTGETKIGILDADSPREARIKLRKENIHVVEIRSADEKPQTLRQKIQRRKVSAQSAFGGKRRLDDVATVTRQMATLLAAGIPLTETLRAIIEQAENKKIEMVFREVREKINQGAGLADALAMHPQYFSELYINMIRAGEASGNLDIVLRRVAEFLAAQRRWRKKVGAALTYPVVLVIFGVVIVMFLMTFVVPKITSALSQQGKILPLPTRVLISISDITANYWWVFILVVAGIIWAIEKFYRSNRGRLLIDGLLLRIPIFGSLMLKQGVARFATTFSTLLKSGVPVVNCLDVSKKIVNNRVLEDVIALIKDRIVEGTDIATPMKMSGKFPPMVGYMVAVGEQSGQLEKILDQIADAYEEEVDVSTQKVTSTLEPILIAIVATVVAFIVLSIIWPILEMSNTQGF